MQGETRPACARATHLEADLLRGDEGAELAVGERRLEAERPLVPEGRLVARPSHPRLAAQLRNHASAVPAVKHVQRPRAVPRLGEGRRRLARRKERGQATAARDAHYKVPPLPRRRHRRAAAGRGVRRRALIRQPRRAGRRGGGGGGRAAVVREGGGHYSLRRRVPRPVRRPLHRPLRPRGDARPGRRHRIARRPRHRLWRRGGGGSGRLCGAGGPLLTPLEAAASRPLQRAHRGAQLLRRGQLRRRADGDAELDLGARGAAEGVCRLRPPADEERGVAPVEQAGGGRERHPHEPAERLVLRVGTETAPARPKEGRVSHGLAS